MRICQKTIKAAMGGAASLALAGGLAMVLTIATTTTVSHQDIASMTGTRTADDNRWLARLIAIPSGAAYARATSDSLTKGETALLNRNYVTGVHTPEAVNVLDTSHTLETGEHAMVNTAEKGDRLFVPVPAAAALAMEAQAMRSIHAMTTAKTGQWQMPQKPAPVVVASLGVDPMVTGSTAKTETPVKDRVALSSTHMSQARAAAQIMAKVMDQVKAKPEVDTNAAIVTAYAPAVEDKTTKQMASAFAAVLRPSIVEKPKEKQEAQKRKNALKKAVDKTRKRARSIIRLAKGDHKWAAKPLPKSSFSKKQRRCLANGIYFEARGESKKGQQAVAQVILNRVKNPTYPNSICGVVYQNTHMRNACQFSFACDGKRDRINSRKHWNIAVKIANDAIEGRFWLRSVGSSSHYHADYVWPRWRKKMRKMTKIGRHIFYRTYGGGWS
ncbi:MAG: cell wall hydrolase [Pseudomonadota bacterium]